MILENVKLISEDMNYALGISLPERALASQCLNVPECLLEEKATLYEEPLEEQYSLAEIIFDEKPTAYFRRKEDFYKAINICCGKISRKEGRMKSIVEIMPTLDKIPATISSNDPAVLVVREYDHLTEPEYKLVCMAFARVPHQSDDIMRNLSITPGEIKGYNYLQKFGNIELMAELTEFDTWGPSRRFNNYALAQGYLQIYGHNQF